MLSYSKMLHRYQIKANAPRLRIFMTPDWRLRKINLNSKTKTLEGTPTWNEGKTVGIS